MELLKKSALIVLSNLKDKKTTTIGISLLIAAALSAGWITKEQLDEFLKNLNTVIVLFGGAYFTGFVGGNQNKNSQENTDDKV